MLQEIAVSVDRYELQADAADTVRVVLDSIGSTPNWGPRLLDALSLADWYDSATSTFALLPWRTYRHADFAPGSNEPQELPADVHGNTLESFKEQGWIECDDVLTEDAHGNYASDPRQFRVIRVLRPFVIQTVTYRNAVTWRDRDTWRMGPRSRIVPPGDYLIGSYGQIVTQDVGCAYLGPEARDLDSLFYAIHDVEGFSATDAFAGCNTCGSEWHAQSGSWHFRPDDGPAEPFDYDDAEDFDGKTFACPHCLTGRVCVDIH